MVGGATIAESFLHAFLYDDNQIYDLNNLLAPGSFGWTLEYADDINNAGQIVGYGTVGGAEHAFLLTPVATQSVPEPGSLALLGLGLAGSGFSRRRH